jgi:hypothetical protein
MIIPLSNFISDKFQDILDTINEKVSYLQSSLRETGDVFPNQEMSSLNTDITRFLLKQKEKQMTDSTDNGITLLSKQIIKSF